MKSLVASLTCILVLTLGLLSGSFTLGAQEKPDPTAPVLTVEQKQSIQILVQRIELAQLRAQAAQVEFEKARAETTQLVQSLQKEGYDLDLQTLTYTKKVPKKE